jgi:hypothetical protein
MEASCIIYINIGMFGQLKQTKICLLAVTKLGIVMLTIQHELIFSISFMQDYWDFLTQTLPDGISLEEFPDDF